MSCMKLHHILKCAMQLLSICFLLRKTNGGAGKFYACLLGPDLFQSMQKLVQTCLPEVSWIYLETRLHLLPCFSEIISRLHFFPSPSLRIQLIFCLCTVIFCKCVLYIDTVSYIISSCLILSFAKWLHSLPCSFIVPAARLSPACLWHLQHLLAREWKRYSRNQLEDGCKP